MSFLHHTTEIVSFLTTENKTRFVCSSAVTWDRTQIVHY